VTRRKGLRPETVVDAATAIVDSDGVAALTLSRVASELGVKPPSLYNHVDGLESLKRNVALRAIEFLGDRLGRAAMGRSGREALRAIATEFRTYARKHPGLYELTSVARPEDAEFASSSMKPVEPVLAVLRGYDFDSDDAIHAARMLRAALHGFVSLERSGGFGIGVDVNKSFSWLVDNLAATLESRRAAPR